MSKNMRAMVVLELARRGHYSELKPEDLAELPSEELAAMLRAIDAGGPEAIPAVRGGRMASTVRERVRGLSIGAAILQACATEALSASQIIEALEHLRPGTNQPSVYPEIKRLAENGHLQRIGKAEPYKYRTTPAMR